MSVLFFFLSKTKSKQPTDGNIAALIHNYTESNTPIQTIMNLF